MGRTGRIMFVGVIIMLVLGNWGIGGECRRLAAENEEYSVQETETVEYSVEQQQHEQWMAVKGRTYSDTTEKTKRQSIFTESALYVSNFNSQGNQTFKLDTNKFADLTADEFRSAHTGGIHSGKAVLQPSDTGEEPTFSHASVTPVPSSLDWRDKGVVTPIKQQGVCGCCWAFAAVAALESLAKIKTGNLYSFSEQQLIDCATDNPNTQGCNGGNQDDAYDYIVKNGGITSEANYPYKGTDGSGCDSKTGSEVAFKISGRENVPPNDEDSLLKAVSQQPVTAFVDSSGKEFRLYSSGVYNGNCGTNLDHIVLIVGYGTDEESGSKYWLIKNSWGTDWGEDGFMRLLRNPGYAEGVCGIAMDASYPVA